MIEADKSVQSQLRLMQVSEDSLYETLHATFKTFKMLSLPSSTLTFNKAEGRKGEIHALHITHVSLSFHLDL